MGPLVATVVMTVLVVVFAEILPKTIAIARADDVARWLSVPTFWIVRLFGPLADGAQWIVRQTLRPFGIRLDMGIDVLAAHEEIRGAVEYHHSEGLVETGDRWMLGGVLDLGEMVVKRTISGGTDRLVVEPYAGWAFPTDEPLLSLPLNPRGDKVWAWTETDVQLVTGGGYVFVQAEYQFNDWLAAGVEGEGWGNWKDGSSWSTGGGPNVLLHYGQLGTDLAVQVRDNAGQVKPQFVMRFHLFL